MTRITAIIAAALLCSGIAVTSTAWARPPNLQNSPGYEARLAESRKAWADYQAAQQQQQQLLLAPQPRRSHRHHRAPAVAAPR